MLSAPSDGMRILSVLMLAGLLGSCGQSSVIEGTLLDADDAGAVWVEGESERATVESLAFRLEGVSGDTIDLLFGDDEDSSRRMRLIGLPGGSQLTLHGVWFEDELAFPTSIDLEGGRTLHVNGLRMGGLPAEVDARGWILAASRDGENLIVRPDDEGLPDLRVVVGPGTTVRSEDGEPASAERLSPRDSVAVRGSTDSGYLLATELQVPRSVAAGAERSGSSLQEEPRGGDRSESEVRESDDDNDDDRDRDREEARGRGQGQVRDGWPGRGRGRGRQ